MAHQDTSIEEPDRSARIDENRKPGGRKVDWEAVREYWIVMNLDPTRPLSSEYTLREVAMMGHSDPRSVEVHAKVQGSAIRSTLAKLERS